MFVFIDRERKREKEKRERGGGREKEGEREGGRETALMRCTMFSALSGHHLKWDNI